MKEVSRAIITDEHGNVLLGKRARGVGAGLYALVGGKLEEGETPSEAVYREVKEEIGLDFQPTPSTPYLEIIEQSPDTADSWVAYYFVGIATGELVLEPNEIEAIIYVSENDLPEIEIAFHHAQRLFEYFQSRR